MAQSPVVCLLVKLPASQLLQVSRLPPPCFRQPFLPPSMADGINIDRVVIAGVGREHTVVPVWRVDRRPTGRYHRESEPVKFLANGITLGSGE